MRVPALFVFVLSLHVTLPGCATTASARDQVVGLSDSGFSETEMRNEENRLREELYLKAHAQ